jgi:hypothetical protein
VAIAAVVVGGVVFALNFGNTWSALQFLGSGGQADRAEYVQARVTQGDLAASRSEGVERGAPPFDALVGGIAADPELQERTVQLTDEPLANNDWLTPDSGIASPLKGLGGLGLCLLALGWLGGQFLGSRSSELSESASAE